MKKLELRKLIREEIRKVIKEAQAPKYKAKHANNNLVAAIYFSWNKAENNNQSLWDKVIQILEQKDCRLINYVVTDSACEFEFQPSIGVQAQDQLDDTKNRVTDALKPLSSQFTGYDVYIVGS
jgi:hypothetical protein